MMTFKLKNNIHDIPPANPQSTEEFAEITHWVFLSDS